VSGRRISTADLFLLFFVERATQKNRNLTLCRQSRLTRIESWIDFEMGWWRPKSATDLGDGSAHNQSLATTLGFVRLSCDS
jgi:hypothetical protein